MTVSRLHTASETFVGVRPIGKLPEIISRSVIYVTDMTSYANDDTKQEYITLNGL